METKNNLSNKDIARYSRQIIVPNVGVGGQCKLKQSSVLIVGAGGLGCPSSLYLVGAGIGRIGIIDYDVVEENNLHRQLLHSEKSVGEKKVKSAAEALKRLNEDLEVDEYYLSLDSSNAMDVVSKYDVVIDASDNVATRYLLNDACVLSGKPLVSGSALQMEGQLTVYNHNGGPCYRCLYPTPPPPHTVSNCSDAGVLGVVPGVIGVLQALEAIKVLLGQTGTLDSRLLLFDASESTFRNVKLRKKDANCAVCGQSPTITQLIDYVQFCGSSPNDKDKGITLLDDKERISAVELSKKIESEEKFLLIDVRMENEFEICALPRSVNIPITNMEKARYVEEIKEEIKSKTDNHSVPVFIVCRRGNDSQKAVRLLQTICGDLRVEFKDIKGGLHDWTRTVDSNFPIY
ncbi:adenylyltransferase and sulfurtransferase MOCS3 [Nilaparvata lugens]|uniref:adenylyltransferase and sulfurtransferase MOCS3 n=1 Tax=Nilaparvata lugens TaxID=108931 RepID=UPI00193E3470|nr:adenylyltransferase and sulfurtransferase MOCS3 [Nilaparvata lugens]XP_039278467.1 adenylyltransferase and sulfurtransferase MOCS3 [Nilaparvata lugens]XP_039278468.1 adenylyltransferase and sulfurtransferase MOCS3 [Nilaparvata lugens]